jgi:hypothetical protein
MLFINKLFIQRVNEWKVAVHENAVSKWSMKVDITP